MAEHTETKIKEAEQKITEFMEIKRVLSALVKTCPGDATLADTCPILNHIRNSK